MKWLARLSLLLAALMLVALIWVRPSPRPVPDTIAGPVERIVIDKAARRMILWKGGRAVREYRVALGFAPEGDLVIVRFEAVDVSDILKINQLMRV